MNTGNTTNQLTELESWYHWIGYRVCISGVKEGVLRHFGPTQFADGLWCGVELDEPVGKNDGSVKGVRYFTCKGNHGIFAPFSKTVKLPLESTYNRTDKDTQLPDEQRRFAPKSKLPPPKIAVKNILSQKGMLQETFVQQVGETESSIPVAYVTGSSRVNDNTDVFIKNENNFEIPYKTRRLSEDSFKTNRIKNSYSCNFSNTNFMFGIPSKTSKRKGSLPINISYTVSANKKFEDNMHLNDFFNTTVTLDNNKSEICKSNSEHNNTFSVNEDNPVLNTTFGLDPLLLVEENTENANEEQIFDRTFILEEPNCSVNHHDITLEKHALSEEDIVSLDFDDSLGILSPSQMKDFTLCTDQHSTVIDTNIVNIPKIESCDDINDLPEYEVAKDVSNLSPDDNSDSILHILPEQIFNANSILAESGCSESKETKSVIHELNHTVDLGKNVVDENHSFETDIVQTSTPFNDNNKMPVSNLSCISSPQLRNKEKMHFYTPIGTALKENVKKSHLDAIKCALMTSEESNKCFSHHIENSNLSQIRDEKLPDLTFNTLTKTSAECHPTMSNNLSFLLSSELNQQNKTTLNPSASLCQDESLNDNIYMSADIANNLYDSQQLINVDLSKCEQQIAENETEKNTILQSSEICNVEYKTLLQQEKSDCFDFVSCKGNQLENIKNLQHLPDQFNQCVQIKEHASNEEFVNNDNRTEIPNTIQSINVDHYDEKLDEENKLVTSSHFHGNENVEQITQQSYSISESQKNSLVKSDLTDSDVFTDSGCVEMELNEIETIEDCHNMTFDISDTVNTRSREDLVINDIECDSDKHQNDITETETNKTVIITNSDVCNTTITSMVLNKTFVDNQPNSTLVRPTTLEIETKITNNKQNNSSVNIDESSIMNATICLSENQKIKNSSLNNLTHCVSSEQSFVIDENLENVSKSLSNVTSTSSSKSSPKRKQNLTKSNNVSNKNINTKVLDKKQLFDNRNMPIRTPKKNVISKIKEMLESSKNISTTDEENESLKKIIRTQKKAGRWNSVTSKIAAGLAEEKSKPKQKKEIASKIDTNLTAARQCVIKKSPKYNILKSNNHSESTNNSNVTPVIKNLKNTFNNQRLIEVKEKKDSGEGLSREGRVLAQLQNVEYTAIIPKDDLRKKNTEQQDNRKNRNYSYPPHLPTPSSDSGSIQSLTSQVSSKQSSKIAVYQRGRVGSAGSNVSHSSKNEKQAPVVTVGVRSREFSAKSIVRQSYAGKSLPSDAGVAVKATKVTLRQSQPPPTPFRRAAAPKGVVPTIKTTTSGCTDLKQGKFPRWSTGPVRSSSQEPKKWVSKTELVKEIQQLGALCESRTKELTLLKIQLRHATLGFEALAVLNLYMTEELDAFSQPLLVKEFKQTQEELKKAGAQLQFYQKQLEELKNIHSYELIELTEKLGRAHLDEINELKKKHTEELEEVEAHHKRKLTMLKDNYDKMSQETEERHDQLIKELQNDYYKEREELEKTHVLKLQEVTDHHEEVHQSLQKQLKDLCYQYELLQQQAKQAEEAFLRDTNSKIKWISEKKADLQKEVDSLKTVLEMKSSQIHDLRKENLEMKKELEELPRAKEKIKKLEAKTEDLYAMMQEKTRLQRKLSCENQQLVENYEKESRVKTRLSMANEELQWRLQQSMEASLRSSSLSGSSEIWERIERENSPTNHLRYRNSLPILPSDREINSVCDTVDNFLMTSSMPAPKSERQSVRCSSMSASWHPTLSSHSESTSATTSPARNRSMSERGTSADFLRTPSKLTLFKKKKKEEMLSLQTKSLNQRSHFLTISKPQQNSFRRHNNEKMCLSWAGECVSDLYEDIDEEYVEIFASKHKKDNFRKQEFISETSKTNKLPDESSSNIPPIDFNHTTGFVNSAFIPEKQKYRKNASDLPKYELLDSCKSDNEDYGTISNIEDKLSENSIISVDSLSGSDSQAPLKVIDKRFEELTSLHENDSQNMYFTNSEYGQECAMDAGSLQNSFNSSSGSSWSISFAPPLHERSSSSTEDSSYSSKSQECGSVGDQSDDKSSSGDVSGSAYDAFYITSPRNLAGEAMVQDDDSLAQVQSQDLTCDLLGETVPANGMDISRELSSSPEEAKEKVAHPVSVGTPSMENSSQGMLMTDSTNMDVSWGEDEMPSECDV